MIIHLIPNPVSALRYVEPMVLALNEAGYDAELWVEPDAACEPRKERSKRSRLSMEKWRTGPSGIPDLEAFAVPVS